MTTSACSAGSPHRVLVVGPSYDVVMSHSEDGWQLFYRAFVSTAGTTTTSRELPISAEDRAEGVDMLAAAHSPDRMSAVVIGFDPAGWSGAVEDLDGLNQRARRVLDRLTRWLVPPGAYVLEGHVWNSGGESHVGGSLAGQVASRLGQAAGDFPFSPDAPGD